MLFNRDCSPKNGIEEFFSREMYDRYTMSPTVTELCFLSKRQRVETETSSSSQPQLLPVESSSQAPAPAPAQKKNNCASFAFPEPRVPYPHLSRMEYWEQNRYVSLLKKFKNGYTYAIHMVKNDDDFAQFTEMKKIVSIETEEFMKYLQNVARMCAEDYNFIIPDSIRYTEDVLREWSKSVKKYPQYYCIQDNTNIMGGKFIPDLKFTMEKNLFSMGKSRFLKLPVSRFPFDISLSTEYKYVSSFASPKERDCIVNSDIMNDRNAAKLSVKYGAQFCMTTQALYTLLNNHGPNYAEQWEIPICVKTINEKGNKVKVICFDSPLVKKELTVREKNSLFYEVPLDLLMSKKSDVPLSTMTLDKPEDINRLEENMLGRKQQQYESIFENTDFDATDLETFGSMSTRSSKRISQNRTSVKDDKHARSLNSTASTSKKQGNKSQPSEDISVTLGIKDKLNQEQCPLSDPSKTKCDGKSNTTKNDDSKEEKQETNSKGETRTKSGTNSLTTETDSDETSSFKPSKKKISDHSDSDDERLIIDTDHQRRVPEETNSRTLNSVPEKTLLHEAEDIPDTPRSPSPDQDVITRSMQSKKENKRSVRKISKEFDPVGQILKMQCKLLKSDPKPVVEQSLVNQEANVLDTHPMQGHVSLEKNPAESIVSESAGSIGSNSKTLLSDELRHCTENVCDYADPSTGNVSYKLFSLADMLIIVRGQVFKAQTKPRSNKVGPKRHIPVFLYPKLNYQPSYGVEDFTDSEACRFWTETLFNSNSWFYIAHIDIFASKIIFLDQFPAASLGTRFKSFKPINSLNILHHILKAVSGLEEGNYLLSHARKFSSVTVYSSSQDKATRTDYNLHATHHELPKVPSTLSVPWVPLDPTIMMPYHVHHGRAPCMFPPKPSKKTKNKKIGAVKGNKWSFVQTKAVSMETRNNSASSARGNQGVSPNKKRKKT
uniref:Little elongation complex subunit 2 C-terminal domain-containing protein n=1 Tax=Callorhinchus milii TaxID=7868 RepID=A0A4W3H967_CALMI